MSDHDGKMAASSSSPMSMPAQSPITDHSNNNAATSPTEPQSASKRSRGRPRKYHTDAEREEAKRRYRENHKTKAASGGAVSGGGDNSATAATAATLVAAATAAPTSSTSVQSVAKQQDVDDLWEVVRSLQDEVAGLKVQLAQKGAAAALPGQKRRKA